MNDLIHITDLESAINWWRRREPSTDGVSACRAVRRLAEPYARMVYFHEKEIAPQDLGTEALQAWLAWFDAMPDTPCIAICSTSQGDPVCKGCGRTFQEVQLWPEMGPYAKRQTWRRITLEGKAWRFNRYAERATHTQHGEPAAD